MPSEAISLAQKLIKFPSVTPEDAGIVDFLIDYLTPKGFLCEKLVFHDVTNLYARYGNQEPNFCFAGHTDVVPAGIGWSCDPFAGLIKEGVIYGRGAVDMKGALAAFICASLDFIRSQTFVGSISFLITGDEEGKAENGTKKLLQYLHTKQEKINACIVGEPTSEKFLGDTIKHGRRGSINFNLTVTGKQGHVAYPELAENPIPQLLKILNELDSLVLDQGNNDFTASQLVITDLSVGNEATNVIPKQAKASFNIRFNNIQTPDKLFDLVDSVCAKYSKNYKLDHQVGAEVFINSQNSLLINYLKEAIYEKTGIVPVLSTKGGTSDARFIKNYAPVVEFGLINKTAHHIDEQVVVSDIDKLKEIYFLFLKKYFV